MGRLFAVAVLVFAACGPDAESYVDAASNPTADAAPMLPDSGPTTDADIPPAKMFVHTADTLYVVDDVAFDLQTVGSFGLPMSEGGVTDLAVTPDGTIYGITDSKLYRINETTAAATYLADVPGVENVGLTFLRDGTLLATDKTGGVRQVNPTTGAVNEIGTFGGGYATAGDLVAVANGTMYAISDQGPVGNEADNNWLLTVNTTNGSASPVGQIGYGGVFGVAVANNKVYAFTRDGEIIEINPTTGAGSLERTHSGISFWGAGVTPLVVID